jgi:hypothetical protein
MMDFMFAAGYVVGVFALVLGLGAVTPKAVAVTVDAEGK